MRWLKGYFLSWKLYFGMKYRISKWKGSETNEVHRILTNLIKDAAVITFDICKCKYGKLLPSNPMK